MTAETKKRDLKAEIYKDKRKQWRWRIVAGNGKNLAMSSESYINKVDCVHCLELILTSEPVGVQHENAYRCVIEESS